MTRLLQANNKHYTLQYRIKLHYNTHKSDAQATHTFTYSLQPLSCCTTWPLEVRRQQIIYACLFQIWLIYDEKFACPSSRLYFHHRGLYVMSLLWNVL